MSKKKLKLKKRPIQLLVILIILTIAGIWGYNRYQLYLYHQSIEYKLLEHGYENKEIELFKKEFDDNELASLLEEDKNYHLYPLLTEKYYLEKNLDTYLDEIGNDSDVDYKLVVSMVNVNAHKDWYDDIITTDLEKDLDILVNKFYALPQDFYPTDLVTISSQYAYANNQVRSEVNDAFVEMAQAAKLEGFNLVANSSFRSYETQATVYETNVNLRGREYADNYAAHPGHSEHQTGLAMDIIEYGLSSDEFINHPSYKWLVDNSYKYGFILRFPEDKEYLTGYQFESWHYRYLGKELAKKVYDEGITYDEYYAYYIAK